MKWMDNTKAALTLCFDDGLKKTYELTRELLLSYNLKATYFVPTAYIGKSIYGFPVMSWSDLKELAKLGMEIGSHSVTHCEFPTSVVNRAWRFLRNLCVEASKTYYIRYIISDQRHQNSKCRSNDVKFEVISSKRIIEENLYPYKVSSFAYPRGAFDNRWKNVVKRAGYLSARATIEGLNYPCKIDFYALKCFVWRSYTTLEFMNKWLNYALESGSWLIELLHLVTDDSSSTIRESLPLRVLERHLDYISNKRIWVDTQGNIVNYIKGLK
jgi:peptidoglycan/xylan/chitin deacetylase (PgdA/CDA1 family)